MSKIIKETIKNKANLILSKLKVFLILASKFLLFFFIL